MTASSTQPSAPVRTERAHKGVGMEGFVATWYARQTAKDTERWQSTALRLAAHIGPDSRVLEIAPGPGYLAIEITRRTGCRMVGLDISRTFVRIAAENARKAQVPITFERGDAAALPFPADQFDFIVCTAAFKNFARPLAALDEMHRVLAPGGVAVVIDLRKDFSSQAVRDYVSGKGLFNGAIIRMTFNTMLKKRAYTPDGIAQLAAQSKFGKGDVRLDPIAFELWLRK
jgi:ubiquinone/menaquinone biosynthesis C-methylase UbiE